jgi:hypothetical protein
LKKKNGFEGRSALGATRHVAFEQYFSTDALVSFKWPIHQKGFAPEELLALARLQGWTLKPARLR